MAVIEGIEGYRIGCAGRLEIEVPSRAASWNSPSVLAFVACSIQVVSIDDLNPRPSVLKKGVPSQRSQQ